MKNIITVILLTSSLILMGCPDNSEQVIPDNEKNDSVSEEILQALNSEILELIQDKSCKVNSDCNAIALGARACGGPERYEVYAPKHTDEDQLKSLAAKLESLNKTYNEKNQITSICSMVMAPNTQCVENQCKAVATSNLIQ